MLERGGFSFVALLVINPVAILLYQNCTFLPVAQSELASRDMLPQKRVISSVSTPEKVDLSKLKVAKPSLTDCKATHESCPVSDIE
jgi:hypothetical protein